MHGKIRVAVNGYGVIGRRVADAVRGQDDMTLVGVADVTTDWRTRVLQAKDIPLFAGTSEAFEAFRVLGIPTAGGLDDLLREVDAIVDCTPKRVAAGNVPAYRALKLKFILRGGRKPRNYRPFVRRRGEFRNGGGARCDPGGFLQHNGDGADSQRA